jgi:hypothetical protein
MATNNELLHSNESKYLSIRAALKSDHYPRRIIQKLPTIYDFTFKLQASFHNIIHVECEKSKFSKLEWLLKA